jgi:tetratricopeptide (TPR) repeat protein
MRPAIVFTVTLWLASSAPGFAQHDHGAGADQVGSDSVSFLTSCAPALRQDFNHALALLHERQIATAWVTFAQGDRARGIELLRAAADAEDATDKSAVSPGPLAPARELLGYMLLEANRPADALAQFEATIKKEPNRFRGVYGGARAAEAAGQRARAIALYNQLLSVAGGAGTGRDELMHARAFVGPQK